MSGFLRSRKKENKEIEPHEVFLDNLAQKKEEEFGSSKRRLEVPLPVGALRIFAFSIFLMMFLLLGRSFQVQVIEGEHFEALAERNILSISSGQASRGIIYDRNYNQIVYNLPQQNLYFQKRKLTVIPNSVFREVGKILNRDYGEIIEDIKKSDSNIVIIKKNLTHEELVQVKARKDDLEGFNISTTTGRDYRLGETFAHILGYIGKIDRETLQNSSGKYTIHDYVGKMGVEKHYESYLTRVGEKIKIERDAAGNIKSEKIFESAENGENVVLTIDKTLQEIAHRKTVERVEELGLKKAAVVVLDPNTGEVLSLVSVPSYDNNIFQKDTDSGVFEELFSNEDGPFLNRIISAGYPTGSIIKPLLAAAALEEGIISPEKRIHSPGYIIVPNPWNPSEPTIFRDFLVHGWRDMREAIAVSSNVYFYAIGGGYEDQEGLGVERMRKYLSLFGWEGKTGIDLPGERSGFIPYPEWKQKTLNDAWRIGDSYNLSIGQGYLSTTPMQVAISFASLINGGRILTPHIVKEIIDDEGNVIEKRETKVVREGFISPENLKVVKEGMGKTTLMGTTRALQVLPVTSGAKTGTAQTSKPGINNNWISAFFPYEEPEMSVTIIVEGVTGVTSIATQLARDILLEYYETIEEEQ